MKNYVDKNIQINLNGNRKLIGKLRGYDPFMNIVLENAKDISKNSFNNNEEHKTNEDNIKNTEIQALGTVMIRGNSIVYWECLDKIQNK